MPIDHQRILVTGGAGFVGSHVVEELVRRGAEVTVVDRLTSGNMAHLAGVEDAIRLVRMDVQHPKFIPFVTDGRYDAIFHFAGPASVPKSVEAPYEDFEQSLHATVRLLEGLRRNCPRTALMAASSAAVYGNPARLPMCETDPTVPISPYGVSKLAMERYVAVYSQLYGIPAASLRFFSIYGPRQRKQIVYDLIGKLTEDPNTLTLLGDGTEMRDFIFVTDVARAVLAVYERGDLRGEVYNVAGGKSYTTLDIARAVAAALEADPEITFTGRVRAGDPVKWHANIDRITRTGFQPRVDINEGIAATVAWYRAAGQEQP